MLPLPISQHGIELSEFWLEFGATHREATGSCAQLVKWLRMGTAAGPVLPEASFHCTLVRRRLKNSSLGVFLDRLMAGFIV